MLQVRVMGIFPVCEELFPMITATFSRKMSSIFTYRMYQVIFANSYSSLSNISFILQLAEGAASAAETVTPLFPDMAEIFLLGKDVDALADGSASPCIPTVPACCCRLKQKREKPICQPGGAQRGCRASAAPRASTPAAPHRQLQRGFQIFFLQESN